MGLLVRPLAGDGRGNGFQIQRGDETVGRTGFNGASGVPRAKRCHAWLVASPADAMTWAS
jgi:hypothetical protein